jgi:23S rRNA (adenine2503-C2)-methyltransferase
VTTAPPPGDLFADRPVEEWVEEWSTVASPDHARKAARGVFRAAIGGAPVWELPGIARSLREVLAELRPRVPMPPAQSRPPTDDGAEKLLLDLEPGVRVESVLIPEARSHRSRAHMRSVQAPEVTAARLDRRPPRASGCISTQVGCAVGCTFCASGMDGLGRNLRSTHMIAQALHLRRRATGRGYHLGALVFMGMGEPFHNLSALQMALRNLTSPVGACFGRNHVTVSTVGVPEGIERLAAEGPAVNLALSLHAPDDETRAAVVPLAERLPPVRELLALSRDYTLRTGRQVTLSYVLLADVNDRPEQARALVELLRPFPELAHVNLIPLNAVEGLAHRRPTDERVQAFSDILRASSLRAHVRRTRGAEADAACGQLRLRAAKA